MLSKKSVAIIVAHPDDETLWAGGTILSQPSWNCFIVCLCRKNDKERAIRFYEALKILKSDGIMGDIDDGPDQKPLDEGEIEQAILQLLPTKRFDLIISHNPNGEYTRHLRHEEASKAIIRLWYKGEILTKELWTFAYEDGGKKYRPRPIEPASIYNMLMKQIWMTKYNIITKIYGFKENSWEAQTTPRSEAFWKFKSSQDAKLWLKNGGVVA